MSEVGSANPTGNTSSGWPQKYCFACANQIDARAEICPRCGVRQPTTSGQPVNQLDAALGRSRLVAALLAIFLGALGIHKFYLGRPRTGVIFIIAVVVTAGVGAIVTAIIGFIEGVQLLAMSDFEFQRRYPPTDSGSPAVPWAGQSQPGQASRDAAPATEPRLWRTEVKGATDEELQANLQEQDRVAASGGYVRSVTGTPTIEAGSFRRLAIVYEEAPAQLLATSAHGLS